MAERGLLKTFRDGRNRVFKNDAYRTERPVRKTRFLGDALFGLESPPRRSFSVRGGGGRVVHVHVCCLRFLQK